MPVSLTVALVLVVLCLFVVKSLWSALKARKYPAPLPPGPPRHWLLGNLPDLPSPASRPWETYSKWFVEYGDLIFLDLPSQPILLIGSAKTATSIMDSRSNIYSDRPRSVMAELLDWEWALSLQRYGSQWRKGRRYMQEHFSASNDRYYQPAKLHEVRTLLTKILKDPGRTHDHVKSLPGSTIVRVAYGPRDAPRMTEFVRVAEMAMDSVRKGLGPGRFLADVIPAFGHIPSWLPGGAARKFAEDYKPVVRRMRDELYYEVKASIAAGKAVPSIAYNLIRQLQGDQPEIASDQDALARDVVGQAYGGAADTTTATAESFMLAMAMYPEVQRKAREELDRVVGPSRLPEFHDIESLPYIKAVVMETMRWITIVPLCIAHGSMEDDVYEGYFIPKGTVILPNLWAMLHDPRDYPDPHVFRPERFLSKDGRIDPSVRDPRTIAFGFGRRICPGADFAINLVQLFAASMLHVFEIQPGVDEAGNPVKLTSEVFSETITGPIHFPKHIKPRSASAERLIRDIVLDDEETIVSV